MSQLRLKEPCPTPLCSHPHTWSSQAPGCVHKCVLEAWTVGKQKGPCGDAEACLSEADTKGHRTVRGLPPKGMSKLSRCREMASEIWPGTTGGGVQVYGKPPKAGPK